MRGADPLAPSFRAERFINISSLQMGGDPSNPLALMVGYDAGTTPDDLCADPGGHGLNLIGQVIFLPQGGVLLRVSGKAINLIVVEFGDGPVMDPCRVSSTC